MSDLVERLRREAGEYVTWKHERLFYRAADEIERLDTEVKNWMRMAKDSHKENQRLREAVQNYMDARTSDDPKADSARAYVKLVETMQALGDE